MIEHGGTQMIIGTQIVKLNARNQLTLPLEARKAMNLVGHDELLLVVKNDLVVIMPRPESFRHALGELGKRVYCKNYLKQERRSW